MPQKIEWGCKIAMMWDYFGVINLWCWEWQLESLEEYEGLSISVEKSILPMLQIYHEQKTINNDTFLATEAFQTVSPDSWNGL
jgi:hypothetical protein